VGREEPIQRDTCRLNLPSKFVAGLRKNGPRRRPRLGDRMHEVPTQRCNARTRISSGHVGGVRFGFKMRKEPIGGLS